MNELDKLLTELDVIAEERRHVEEACNLTWIRGHKVERYRRGNIPVAGVWIDKWTGKLVDNGGGNKIEVLSPVPLSPQGKKKRKPKQQVDENGGLWG